MIEQVYLIPLLPLIGFVVLGLFGKRIGNEKLLGMIGASTVGAGFLIALSIFFGMTGMQPEERSHVVRLFTWIHAGDFTADLAYRVDQLSILFTMIITGIGFLIHVYSIGYMHGDKSFFRFFAYLNLFVFMMLNLVLANNFLVTFLGWEGVGLASYLLIGFWYDQKFEGTNITWTGDAAKKAFIVNRIGDFGMLIAMFIAYQYTGSLDYDKLQTAVVGGLIPAHIITYMGLAIFLGCTGKSAQIPLGVWLPDAMAGPTPVSALIHAATMVTSGIFLIARTNVVFASSHTTLAVVTGVGICTAFFAATVGIAQNDIKKVLAYSTVSQLGFMFIALGVGAFWVGVFHVMTHAFFKALLFLGAGSVIHGMHHEQDIMKMGGLKKHMKITHLTFFIGTLAIAGIPGLSGFFSKDEILWKAFSSGSPVLWGVGVAAAFCTAFYMFRMFYLTFHGEERFDHHHVHPHESPLSMTFPLMVLAVFSIIGGYFGIPHAVGALLGHAPNLLEHWLEPVFADADKILNHSHAAHVEPIEYGLMVTSTVIAIIGIFLARSLYRNYGKASTEPTAKLGGLHALLSKKYLVDELYQAVFVNTFYTLSNSFLWKIFDVKGIDGVVNGTAQLIGGTAERLRRIQTGVAQNYAVMMMAGIVAVLGYMVFVR
ncbi:MAG: NADH-quinone oxidoreductase subunit L [Candidatus Kapabacteria bacterium]|nr:NADH-quinone oxidoreductase subunit L [Candidatus Kapabacteria bacterium]